MESNPAPSRLSQLDWLRNSSAEPDYSDDGSDSDVSSVDDEPDDFNKTDKQLRHSGLMAKHDESARYAIVATRKNEEGDCDMESDGDCLVDTSTGARFQKTGRVAAREGEIVRRVA